MAKMVDLDEFQPLFVDKESLKDLNEIAKKQGKSLVDVTSDALRSHIDKNKELKESKERKILFD